MRRRRASGDDDGLSDALLPPGVIEGWGSPRRRSFRLRRPWLLALLAPLVIVIVVVLIVAMTPLKVTGVYAYQRSTIAECQGVVTIQGVIDTNGLPGTVRYEWVRPDGTISPVTTLNFSFGQSSQTVRMTWIFSPQENGVMELAVLMVLTSNAMSSQADLFYYCT